MKHAPWFSTADRRALLAAESEAWLRTPFCLHAQAKGAGVDCVHLVHALARATGWPHALTPPGYTAQDTLHSADSKLHAYLDAAAGIEFVGEHADIAAGRGGEVQPGDLVSFTIGRAAHHLGIIIGGRRFVHVMSNHFTTYASLADGTWGRRASRVYRLVDVTLPAPA